VRTADLILLESISTGTIVLAVVVLVVVGWLRGHWRMGLRGTVAVVGALLSAELFKHLLPSRNEWTGQWRWLSSETPERPGRRARVRVRVRVWP
jgi:hypothetical protein